ncbi:hypothetical protein SAMN05216303_102295 [Rhodoferax sp. OV413]|uniref:hypothetical protein n=1 Tax=Rhodoferax sp. OV413 TaxID=1855285 RepID=UPI0008899765|nr:hypothetical protein [Rhodoferax sp. OV413]SDO76449.1 hypothetical protein SAMN05216303_102295 [Rhodoferax sp. OV413]
MATKSKDQAAGPATKGLKIIARCESFRRAGHSFGADAKTISLADLTDDQVDLLKGERLLVVQEVDIEPKKEPAADPAAKK